ncbi:type I restriction-modification system subunit M [Mycoplasma sp. 21DD0573]|uniref:type I restriction-modification system subunit M n=1 Tax=unclassified Mycoplasma TaxID=2683645 RepID=UPI002B1E50ED|nr:type I restriction-modification system subunit M [Mycoplasma sp. 21DD0573]MEA4276481.1 type I restriction-modification system subunit M [Mycoplasma sp. 21DD0573]
MDNTKEIQRAELHKTIWNIADQLRSQVDGWEFKNYVLGTLFYRFISESITRYVNAIQHETGDLDFNYETLSDDEITDSIKEAIISAKGFFIYPSQLFTNVEANATNDENLNETLENIFKNIENSAKGRSSEGDLKGLFEDFDVNSNKLGNTVAKCNATLRALLTGVKKMELGNFEDNTIDLFGDAYEFLISMYAQNAGKSGGEFFTPQEVSKLLFKLALGNRTEVRKVYDMCAGSGSLLLQSIKVLGKDNIKEGLYGQEKNVSTYNLCRINMFLHDINYSKFKIVCDDTLTHPGLDEEEPFDVIVSNPPYSIKWEGDANATLIADPRFAPAGVLAPKSKADWAFVQHALHKLSADGTAAIVCFPGIMYRAGAEAKIRKYFVDNNFVDAIIQLPDNLFYGTSISTCILVIKKNKTSNEVKFIDASKEFIKITNNNKLTDENIQNIINLYNSDEDKVNVLKIVRTEDIAKNNYSLSVNTYIEKEDTREAIDIKKLNQEIKEIVAEQVVLRAKIDEIVERLDKSLEDL